MHSFVYGYIIFSRLRNTCVCVFNSITKDDFYNILFNFYLYYRCAEFYSIIVRVKHFFKNHNLFFFQSKILLGISLNAAAKKSFKNIDKFAKVKEYLINCVFLFTACLIYIQHEMFLDIFEVLCVAFHSCSEFLCERVLFNLEILSKWKQRDCSLEKFEFSHIL